MGAENLNPLDELQNLDHQIDLVSDLAALKPIFYRLDEIAKQNASDFEVQLVVGDLKQHLVQRGMRLRDMAHTSPTPMPVPSTAPSINIPPPPPPAQTSPAIPPPSQFRPPADLAQTIAPGSSVLDLGATNPALASTNPALATTNPALATHPEMLVTNPVMPPPLPEDTIIPEPQNPPTASFSNTRVPPIPSAPSYAPPPRVLGNNTGAADTGPAEIPVAGARTPRVLGADTSEAVPPPLPPPPVSSLEPGSAEPVAPPQAGPPKLPPPKKPPSGPRSPLNWKRALVLGALAGSVLSVVLIAMLVNQARKRNLREPAAAGTVQVSITTVPSGAAIRIASAQADSAAPAAEIRCTSDCKIALAPGNYQVTAFVDGYQPAANSLTVAAGQPATVNLALVAQPPTLRILTDLDQGKVLIDNQTTTDLQEGQLILDQVPPGQHTVKVTGKNGEASFAFEIAEAKPPMVSGPVTARNLAAVVVSSQGSQARVYTNTGPMKLVLNGQPQEDATPAGVDLHDFQPGVDELVLGDGKDQRNVKESFGPAPMLTVFLKSDVNAGTLIVSTGEDGVRVFLNDKEYRRRTQRGQLRIQTLGDVSVRVVKDGFQDDPPQMAQVQKGAEVRLEFKMTPLPQVGALQIHGALAGAEVFVDQKSAGIVGADGNLSDNSIPPGDHTIEIRHDQFVAKKLQRTFKAGQAIVLTGADVVLAASNGVIKIVRGPANAAITYHRADESESHDFRGNQMDLPAGNYVIAAKAPGYVDHTERVQLASGETRNLDLTLARVVAATPPISTGMGDFEDPTAWRQDGELWVHKGGGFVPFKLPDKGVFTFTVELLKGGGVFRGGRIRWAVEYVDAKNYLLFELDRKTFWAEVVENGKKLERAKMQHDLDKQKAFTIQIDVSPDRLVHKVRNGDDWIVLDSFSEPGRNFTQGKFGFLIQGNDEIGISDFKFAPK